VNAVQEAKTYDKTIRHTLSQDDRATFVKSATGYVLTKHNKLATYSIKENEDGLLDNIRHVKLQLRLLRSHMKSHDISDVVENIVVPYNVGKSPQLGPTRYNLIDDFPKLTADQIAASNAWYNLWVDQDYITENMGYVFELLRNNTSETLWNECLELYEGYPPVLQGGPLMLYLLLEKIQSNSECAIKALEGKISKLKIRDVQGENVAYVVSLIRNTHRALDAASTDDRNYVPDDFPLTVLKIFQTSSNTQFNAVFRKRENDILSKADMTGRKPVWPTVDNILTHATNTHTRLVNDPKSSWHVPSAKKKQALNTTGSRPPTSGNDRGTPTRRPQRVFKCFNCGENHLLKDCPKKRNKETIDKARAEFMRNKQNRNGSGQSPSNRQPAERQTKTGDDGTPLVLNVKGQWVPDTKKIRANARAEALAALKALKAAPTPPTDDKGPPPDTSAVNLQISRLESFVETLI